ncbi:hypothetical protein DXT76_02420, partial [Halobacillus trueperi]
ISSISFSHGSLAASQPPHLKIREMNPRLLMERLLITTDLSRKSAIYQALTTGIPKSWMFKFLHFPYAKSYLFRKGGFENLIG